MTLHLTLKKKWFDMILTGIKKEEYREIKPYWLVRFIEWKGMSKSLKEEMCTDLKRKTSAARWNFDNNYCQNIEYSFIEFKNGYSKNAPSYEIECLGIEIGEGKTKWGAEKGKQYFILKLGRIITENRNH